MLPYRLSAGRLQLLLITSRETRRWVVPRGNRMLGLSPQQSAAEEAWEEAGIVGQLQPEPIGSYRYDKRKKNGSVVPTEVELFPLLVVEERERWPEAEQRERRWFEREAAAEAVDEPDLKTLIRGFSFPGPEG